MYYEIWRFLKLSFDVKVCTYIEKYNSPKLSQKIVQRYRDIFNLILWDPTALSDDIESICNDFFSSSKFPQSAWRENLNKQRNFNYITLYMLINTVASCMSYYRR